MFVRSTHLALLCLSALVAAGCTVDSAPAAESPARVTASVPDGAHDIFLPPLTRTIDGSVPGGATLASLFARHYLGDTAHSLVAAIREVFDPRRLRVDNAYRLVLGVDEEGFRQFLYHVDDDEFLRVNVTGDGFEAALVPYRQLRIEQVVEGGIDAENNSLVAALDAQDKGVLLAVALAEVLSGEIDFNNDLRRGDEFSLLYEEIHREELFGGDGEPSFSRYGDVLASEFTNDGRHLQAFRFHVPGEPEAQYFDENGRSMKRLFLRSPFRFEPRITSRFSYRRLHPVLGGVRPHLGVDYGAPTGTPVIAVATGTVVSAGRSGGSGNMVQTAPYQRLRDVLPAPVRVRQGHPPRQARVSGPGDREGRLDGARDRPAPRLPDPEGRRVRQSAPRAPQAAARRSRAGRSISRCSRRCGTRRAPDFGSAIRRSLRQPPCCRRLAG